MEGSEQSLGYTGQCGSQAGEGISGARATSVCVRKSHVCSQIACRFSDQTIFDGLQEQSRLKISNELWRFIEVDNREAVEIGDLEKNLEAIKVVQPKINVEEQLSQRPPSKWKQQGQDAVEDKMRRVL